MSRLDLKNYVDAMLETSSVAAHDISGQVHVMQFCVEELEDQISEDGKKYLDRLQSSLDELTDIISFYRTYIKKDSPVEGAISARTFLENVLHAVQVNFWNEFKKINFKIDAEMQEWRLSAPYSEVGGVIFSVMAIYLEELKKGQIDGLDVELTLKKLDSQHCQFTLCSSKSVETRVFEGLDESSSPGAKVHRKNLGHKVILDSDLYTMEVISEDQNFRVELNMKVLDE
ncbi:ATP-binding protein [Halobacteriovorax marinus]|nr:hypothetical protein [Halobacteriovorax marinus]